MLQASSLPEQPSRYCFHADVEFDNPARLENLLRVLPLLTSQLRVLGVYCKGLTY
jgi:prephenate dehydratase